MVLSQHYQPEDRPPWAKSRLLRNWRWANTDTWVKDSGTKAYKGSNEWTGEMYRNVCMVMSLSIAKLLLGSSAIYFVCEGMIQQKKSSIKNPPPQQNKNTSSPSIYPSSPNHGSKRWVTPSAVPFKYRHFSTSRIIQTADVLGVPTTPTAPATGTRRPPWRFPSLPSWRPVVPKESWRLLGAGGAMKLGAHLHSRNLEDIWET